MAGITLFRGLILLRKSVPFSVLVHERTHEREWSMLWLVKYLLSPMFRMEAELRGYAMQAKVENVPVRVYYTTIRDGYMLTKKAKKELALLMGIEHA
jgi:hypothetical protein